MKSIQIFKNMKLKKLYFLGLLVMLIACKKEEIETFQATIGEEVRLKEQQTVNFSASPAESSHALNVRLEEVNDKRCPSTCVAYGNAVVSLKVRTGTEVVSTIKMCIGDCSDPYFAIRKIDTAEVSINGLEYMIRLLEVTPHPDEKNTKPRARTVKEAKLIVDRL
jgi:hypothetical protein